jgi:Kef-type K+ transport system membrane component KefB
MGCPIVWTIVLVGSVEATLLVLLVIIVAGPIVAERFRIPGLVGLIAGGMLVGPFVLGWIGVGGLVSDLGAIGLLYLMFLAGVSFNMRAFFANRSNAIVYGLLGFFLPFVLSVFVSVSYFEVSLLAAALIGAMWASNTLVAYPDVLAAGLQDNRAVGAAVSAGVVADLLSLTVLAVVSSTAVIDIDGDTAVHATTDSPVLPVWLGIPLLAVFTLWLLPKIAEWFFVRVGHSRVQRFVFALVAMAAGASVALLGGIEGLIGAFLAGLGLNRLIPARSGLMDRLDFVGGSIFIPAFLVSIGLTINPALLFDAETVLLAVVFTLFVIVGKSAAALVTGAIFKISLNEIGLMSSLSFGQAASTLAIAQVGISLGFFDQLVVNAAVLTIVSTALITSFATRFFAQRVERPVKDRADLGESVLVDVRGHGSHLEALMKLGGLVARADDGVMTPYLLPQSGQKDVARLRLDQADAAAASLGYDTTGRLRVDESFAGGSLDLVDEADASLLILAWEGIRFPSDFMFGNEIDVIGERCPVPSMAVHVLRPWTRVLVMTGDMSVDWKAEDSVLAVVAARRLTPREGTLLIVTSDIEKVRGQVKLDEHTEVMERPKSPAKLSSILGTDDLVVAPAHVLAAARGVGQWRLAKTFKDVSVAVIAGPHRLTVSSTRSKRNAGSFVGPSTEPVTSTRAR